MTSKNKKDEILEKKFNHNLSPAVIRKHCHFFPSFFVLDMVSFP